MQQFTLIDARATLQAALITDPDVEDSEYRRLPAVDSTFPEVFVHNERTAWAGAEWHVSCDLGFYDADPDEILALAAALRTAAQQATVLNAERVLSAPGSLQIDADLLPRLAERPVARLVSGITPDGRDLVSFGRIAHLEREQPGYLWGDEEGEGYAFEYVGDFRYIGTELRDGRKRALLVEISPLPVTAGNAA